MAGMVVAEIEHLQCQLAAGDDKRSSARHPAGIVLILAYKRDTAVISCKSGTHLYMNAGIVDADDLPFDPHRVGDVDHVLENRGQPMSHRGLSVAGRSIEEHGASGVQRRAGLFQNALLHLQIAHRLANAAHGNHFAGQLLHIDLITELRDGNRGRPRVPKPLERIDRPSPPLFGERITHVDHVVGVAGSQGVQQLPVDRHVHQFAHHVVGELDGIDELTYRFQPAGVDQLHEKAEQFIFFNAGSCNVDRLGGNAMQIGVQGRLVNCAGGDQVVAQTSTVVVAPRQRRRHIRFRHALGPDQQVT